MARVVPNTVLRPSEDVFARFSKATARIDKPRAPKVQGFEVKITAPNDNGKGGGKPYMVFNDDAKDIRGVCLMKNTIEMINLMLRDETIMGEYMSALDEYIVKIPRQ